MKNVLVMEDECHLEMTIATLVYIYNVFLFFPFYPEISIIYAENMHTNGYLLIPKNYVMLDG